ncbi:MAG: tetratricopeptide repeat protein [Burkholderiales bacterium]
MAPGELRQRLTAILAADVAGYTRLMAADASATVAALEQARALFRREIEAHAGRVVDMAGDSVLALFESAAGAVHAALAVQQALERASAATPEARRLRVRIGVHLGDVMEKADGTVYGHGVNIAARLQSHAAPGGVCMSEALYESVKERLPVAARFAGRQRLKNIDEPIALWQVLPEGASAADHSLAGTPNNLPLQLTSFIGRDGELAEAAKLLERSRLLTFLGAGGIGKSRLSLELAWRVLHQFPDGTWLVELATLRDAHLVPQAVASVLGVKEVGGAPVVEALAEHLRERETLVILDNCEHLLQPCAELARALLQAAPRSKIVTSSREPLRITGEQICAVPALPDGEAVRLFADRAAAALPNFRVNGQASAVASICRRLDGIPLAIELAAARVRTLPVDAIAKRLDDRFRLLTGGDRTALPRQRTLRALIDWSYDLLSETQRAVFRRLAVFAGGWTLEAAEEITAGGEEPSASVVEHLGELTEKSLVVPEADRSRYRLLETVREYAQERLAEAGEVDATRNRHLQFFLSLAKTARPQLAGRREAEWLARLDVERDNLLAAHAWCGESKDSADAGLELAYLLRPYWINRGLLGLGRRLTIEALNRPAAKAGSLARCRGLFDAGQLSYFMGRYGEAREYLDESLWIARELDDKGWVASVLQPLGMARLGEGDLAGAHRQLSEALELAEQSADRRELAGAVNAMAQLYRVQGRLQQAKPLYEKVLRIARELGDQESVAVALLNLAIVAVLRGAEQDARGMLLQVLHIADEIGSKPAGQGALEVCAGYAAALGQARLAARLYGAAETQAGESGFHRDPADEAFLAPLVAKSRTDMGDAFADAETAGRNLDYAAAIGEARRWLESQGA